MHTKTPAAARAASFDMDTMKLLKTQDANYVTSRATMEAKVRPVGLALALARARTVPAP